MIGTRIGRATGVFIGLATALVIVTVALVPFLTPAWLAFEQDRAQATAWTGFTDAQVRTATDAIVADLVVGPPDFDVEIDGEAVLTERERSHMRDVRAIFLGFWGLAALAVALLVVTAVRAGEAGRPSWFRAIRRGAGGLGVAIVIVGAVAAVAFEPLFEVFHRVFFAGGSYTFDPETERLVQLFPFAFWQETTIAVGVVVVALSVLVWLATSRASVQVAR